MIINALIWRLLSTKVVKMEILNCKKGNCESRNAGTRNGNKMRSAPEIRCKVCHDERACAHGYRRDC